MENYLHKIRKICFALDKDWHDSIMRSDGLSLATTTEGNSSLTVITNIYIEGESKYSRGIGKTGLTMVKSLEIQVSGIRSFVVAVFNCYFILVRCKWKE